MARPVRATTAKLVDLVESPGGPLPGGPSLPPCTPAPPIDPNLCQPEEPAPAPPVPPNGICKIDVLADWIKFTEGQGFTEGKAEASATFTITDVRTGDTDSTRFPSSGSFKMKQGTEHTLGGKLGTYTVKENKQREIEVCATFREHDLDVVVDINGDDDVGTGCETITLTCPQASDSAVLQADLCMGGDCAKLHGAMSGRVKVLTADADRDCVENEHDYTPEPCDEAFKGQLCRASLVYFYYGDGALTTLAQSLGTKLTKAMTGYDRVVLHIDQAQIGPFGVNSAALNLADVVMEPSEQAFFASLQDLTSRGCDIDVWMFSHGGPDWEQQADLSVIPAGGVVEAIDDDEHTAEGSPDITTDELAEDTDPVNSGTAAVPVRMTYGVPCFYEAWNQAWLDTGALVTGGAIDLNFRANFFGNFANHWNAGQTYGTSIAGEYSLFDEVAAFGWIYQQGLDGPWWCIGSTVLGKNDCAKDFFIDSDLLPVADANSNFIDGPDDAKYGIGGPLWDTAGIAYDSSASGADNMRASSAKVLVGNTAIRKNQPPTLTWP